MHCSARIKAFTKISTFIILHFQKNVKGGFALNQLSVVEYKNTRVLTTLQLAESFESSSKIINRNFQRNRDRYISGIHYFALTGDELKEFKGMRQNDATLKYTSTLYLWTEKGAWLHAKSLNNEKAWQAYNMLIDSYYQIAEKFKKMQQPISISYQQWTQLESRVSELEKALQQVTLHSGEQIRLRKAVGERVAQLTQDEPGARRVLFHAIYSAIKERYGVGSYRDVKQCELQECLRFVYSWKGGNAS